MTALALGPIAQFWLIPYMNSDAGKSQLGWLLGSGEVRGIALVFVIAGFLLLVATLLAFASRAYRLLSGFYARA